MTHEGHLGLLACLHLPHLVRLYFLLPSHDVRDSSVGAGDTQASLTFPLVLLLVMAGRNRKGIYCGG